MKSHMELYTMALLFVKGVLGFFYGLTSISIFTMLEMLIAGMAVSCIECACFPQGEEFVKQELLMRTGIWAGCTNLILIGGAVLFDWFGVNSAIIAVILIVVLELGLIAMWVGFHIAEKIDTRVLNQGLGNFQK